MPIATIHVYNLTHACRTTLTVLGRISILELENVYLAGPWNPSVLQVPLTQR